MPPRYEAATSRAPSLQAYTPPSRHFTCRLFRCSHTIGRRCHRERFYLIVFSRSRAYMTKLAAWLDTRNDAVAHRQPSATSQSYQRQAAKIFDAGNDTYARLPRDDYRFYAQAATLLRVACSCLDRLHMLSRCARLAFNSAGRHHGLAYCINCRAGRPHYYRAGQRGHEALRMT